MDQQVFEDSLRRILKEQGLSQEGIRLAVENGAGKAIYRMISGILIGAVIVALITVIF